MNEKIKKLIYPIFGAVVALFALLMPIFNLYDVSMKGMDESETLSGYEALLANSSFLLLIGLLIVVCILLAVLAFFEADEAKQKNYIFMATIILVIASLFYLICGCTTLKQYDEYKDVEGITISTPSFWALIISAVLMATYCFLPKIVEIITAPRPVVVAPVEEPAVAPATTITPASEVAPAFSVEDITATLTKYKTLLDAGAITQEEYDKKKDELLNS